MRYLYSQWKLPIALAAMGALVVGSTVLPSYSLAASTDSVATQTGTQPIKKTSGYCHFRQTSRCRPQSG